MVDTLIIRPIFALRNTTAKYLQLAITFGIRDTCNASEYLPMGREFDVRYFCSVKFSIDYDNGQVPNLTIGSCATLVGAVAIVTEVKELYSGATCPVLKTGVQPAQQCAFQIDSGTASRVSEQMLNETKC